MHGQNHIKLAMISLYHINWLVFTTDAECVHCAVRTGFYIIQFYLSSKV